MKHKNEREIFSIGDVELEFAPASTIQFQNGKMHVHLFTLPLADERPDLFLKTHYPQLEVRITDITFPTDAYQVVHHYSRYGNEIGLWIDGLAGSMLFQGSIEIDNGFIQIDGYLHDNYGSAAAGPRFYLRKQFSPGPIDPRLYRHRNLEYALTINPEFVGCLIVELSQSAKLPDEFFHFTRLRSLELWNVDLEQTANRFDELKELESLSIRGGKLLPSSLFKLPSLQRLIIDESHITSLPDEIGGLVSLQSLKINRTTLNTVPANLFDLQALDFLDLSWNKLKSLPDTSNAKRLRYLYLKGNAFTSLPKSLTTIPNIDIEAKMKPLFMDATYKSGGKRKLNDKAFSALGDKAFTQLLDPALERHQLQKYRKELMAVTRKGVNFSTTDLDDYSQIGNTRFGGDPDLPPTMEYPITDGHHWIFIAQINLAEIAAYQTFLPREGLLTFLVKDLEYVSEVKVLHHPSTQQLVRCKLPADAVQDQGPFRPFRATAEQSYSLPYFYRDENRLAPAQKKLLEIQNDYNVTEAYASMREEITAERTLTDNNDKHGMNVYVFTQNDSMEEHAAERCGGQPNEWIILLSVGFDRNCDFCFWDAGKLAFAIHKQDLANQDFSKVVASIESS